MAALLELEEVHADIGQFQILQGVSLTVPEGEVTVLLGRNGAGKTTTLRTIMGYVRAKAGAIRFRDRSLLRLPTHRISRAGVGYLPEDGHVFVNLTVAENLRLAVPKGRVDKSREAQVLEMFPDPRARGNGRPAR